jgi:hypothetical protein
MQVTIEDIIKPFFSSGGTVTSATNAQGQVLATSALGAVVTYNAPVGADNCSVVSNVLTAGFASGSVFPIGTTTVTYTVTDGAGLTEISSFDIVVSGLAPSLTAPANITVNNDEGQCGATVSFAATGSVGVPAATITYTEDGQPVVSGSSFAIGVHTITATATNAVGSSSVSFTITVINTDHPTITAQGPTNFCENGSVTLTASEGSSYYWSTGETTQSITVYSAGNYSASVTNAYGCPTNTNTITTTTITIPTAPEIAGAGEVCANSSTVLTSDITGGVWSSENESIATVDAQGKVTGVSEGSVQIMYAVTNESGCTNMGYFTVYVKPLPLPGVITGVTDICVGVTSRLDVTNLNGRNDDRSVWTTSNANVVTIAEYPSGIDIIGIGLGTATITKTLTLNGCTAVIATAVINVRSIPIFTVVPENKTAYSITNQCNALVSYIVEATGVNTPTLSYSFTGATTGSGVGTGSGQSFNVGITNVTITATNQCGSSSISFTVTVIDNIPPTFTSTLPNITIEATSANGAIFNYTVPVAFDNCSSNVLVTALPASGSLFAIGNTTVTIVAVDNSGNSTQSTFIVTVKDTQLPIVKTKDLTVYLNAQGSASITAADVNNNSTDNTGISSMSVSPNSFNCADLTTGNGNAVMAYTGATPNGIQNWGGTLGMDFNVVNPTGIVISQLGAFDHGQNGIIGTQAGGSIRVAVFNRNTQSIVPGLDVYIAGSNDPLVSFHRMRNVTPVTLPVGNYSIVALGYNGSELNGNSGVAGYPATNTNSNSGAIVFTGGARAGSTLFDFPGSADGGPASRYHAGTFSYSTGNPGKTVVLSVIDSYGNTGTATAKVTVLDTIKPNIVAPANISVNATSAAGAIVTYVAPVGTDNCSATTAMTAGFASGSTFPIGVTTVTYTATDASGNTASASFTVTVSGLAPVVVVPANITVNVDENTCGAAVSFAATDNTGIPASTITYTENGMPVVSGATFSTGLHTITVTATNAVGSSSASFTITVIDNQLPVISAPANISVIATSAAGAMVTYVAPVGTDNCGLNTVMTAGLASGSTFPIGVTTVTYTATDASGNTASTSFTVTVVGIAPVIVVPENILQNNDAGQCGASVSFAATETTAIPASTIVYTENGQTIVSGHFFSVGTHTITATATNAVGSSSGTFTITILDKQAPLAIAKNITVGLSAVGGTVSITAADVNNGSSDACGIASMTVMPSSFSCANVGANTVTLTVTDVNGNVSTTTAIVTVVDDKGPVPTAVLPVISGQCSVKLELVSKLHQDGDGCNSNDREKYHNHKNTRGKGHEHHDGEGDDDDDDDHENNGAIQIIAPTAMDNCSGLIKGTTTDPLVYNNQGTYIIHWKFVDARGNVTIQEQTVIVKDTQAPRPKYANLPTITGQCSVSLVNTNSSDDDGDHEGRRDDDDHDGDDDHDRYNEHQMGAPWAKDNCSGWVRGTTTDPLTYSVQGTYIIHWTFNDGHGNISTQNQTVIVKDITKPKIKAPNDKTVTCGSNTAPAVMGMATATDNCSVPVITYTDVNSGNQIVRTWKATDAAGNFSTAVQTIKLSTAFSGSVVSVPTSNVYTGGEANNLYLGYGAQGTALTVTSLPSSGAPYTYSWTGVATNRLSATNTAAPVFSPTAGGVYTFTVTMTNKNGCSNTASISICVTDIRVPGSNGALVYVCHKGSGKTGGTKTLQVPVAQVASHIQSNTCGGKNDRLGSCDQNPCNSDNDRSEVDPKQLEEPIEVKPELKAAPVVVEELKVVVMPNPTTTYFTIRLESKDKAPVNLRVMDGSGRVIDAKQKMEPNSSFQMGHGYSSGTYYAEFIQGNKRKVIQLIKGRG